MIWLNGENSNCTTTGKWLCAIWMIVNSSYEIHRAAMATVSSPSKRSDAKERFKIESEISPIFEENPDCKVVIHCRDFDSFNDLSGQQQEGYFQP